MSTTPAGWYDDGSGRQRWWDGTQWTEHLAPGAEPAAYGQAAYAGAAGAVGAKTGLGVAAIVGIAAAGAVVLAGAGVGIAAAAGAFGGGSDCPPGFVEMIRQQPIPTESFGITIEAHITVQEGSAGDLAAALRPYAAGACIVRMSGTVSTLGMTTTVGAIQMYTRTRIDATVLGSALGPDWVDQAASISYVVPDLPAGDIGLWAENTGSATRQHQINVTTPAAVERLIAALGDLGSLGGLAGLGSAPEMLAQLQQRFPGLASIVTDTTASYDGGAFDPSSFDSSDLQGLLDGLGGGSGGFSLDELEGLLGGSGGLDDLQGLLNGLGGGSGGPGLDDLQGLLNGLGGPDGFGLDDLQDLQGLLDGLGSWAH